MENLISFFEDAKDVFWVVDDQYRLVYGNKSFYAQVGKVYNIPPKKGDIILNIEAVGTAEYELWKNNYNKAFELDRFVAEFTTKLLGKETVYQFEFKLLKTFLTFVSIRATAVPIAEIANTQPVAVNTATAPNIKNALVITDKGIITEVAEKLNNLLGNPFVADGTQNFYNFLHPEEKELVLLGIKKNEQIIDHWCRLGIQKGKYIWCNISLFKNIEQKRIQITVNDAQLQTARADLFVPDTNLLQVIAESQNNFITYSSADKAIQPCLAYIHNLGLANYSFVGLVDWKGLQPTITISVSYGALPHFTHHISQLLQYLSFLCSDVQRDINNGYISQVYPGFTITFLGESFVVYNLIYQGKLMGVWVISSKQTKELLLHQSFTVSYLRSVINPLLQNIKSADKTNSIIHNLSASKDELLSLVASLDDIVFEFNQSFEFVHIWCNNEGLLPKPKEQMLGKSLRQVYNADFSAPFENAISKVIASGKSETIEFDSLVKSEKKWFMARLNYVKLFSGEVRVSMMVRDITEKKIAEVAVAKALQKEKEFNEMKARMIQSVSHEFRTPLATVVSSTELLEMYIKKNYGAIGERATELFTTIYDEIERLSDMMRNFLVMGRFEENQTPFRPKLLNVHELIARIIKTRFQNKYEPDKIVFNFENQPQDAEIDESLFWHIITNIVSNAIKYSPESAPVSLKLVYLEQGFVLTVTDKGIGIPEKDLPNIFQSFYRAGNSEDHTGYGLGLSIVDRFVKMHKATIEVQSAVNKGTSFILKFYYKIP